MTTTRTPVPGRTARSVGRADGAGRERDREAETQRFRQYRATGDRDLRNALIEEHRWLALHCAKRFANKGEPLDDLVQVAMLGVLKAVERFDPDFGSTFATFAVPTMTGELRRHFRDTTWAVHVPRRAKDLQHTVKVAVDDLGHTLGRSPTVAEIASQSGVPVEDVLEALEAARCYRKTPLATANEDDEHDDVATLGELDRGLDAVEATATVDSLLAELPAASAASSTSATGAASRSRTSQSWSGSARSRCRGCCGRAWPRCATRCPIPQEPVRPDQRAV